MKSSCSLFASPLAQVLLRVRARQGGSVRQVGPGLFCGGAPSERRLRALAARGVRQVIDLRLPHESKDGSEAALCAKLGLEYVCVPMGETLPDFPTTERLLAKLASTPTYLHCQQAHDRAGVFVALHRTVSQGWSLPRAGAELLRHGFDARLEILARDICFYTCELQRTRRSTLRRPLATVSTC
jgi:Tyrosine phosphatase family